MEPMDGLVVLGVLTLYFSVMYALGRNEVEKRELTCPHTGTTAHVDVVQRYRQRWRPVRVKSCDLLGDSERIDCEQGCLECPGAGDRWRRRRSTNPAHGRAHGAH